MVIDKIALTLAIIGALNWGSIGLFKFDIVAWAFSALTALPFSSADRSACSAA